MIPESCAAESLPQLALVVDADQDTLELYRLFLSHHRFNVDTASDGWRALVKATTDVPDVIVTETHLDGIDGYWLCELLRAERDTAAVPIVVLTSEARPQYLSLAREAGADAVLTKPCLPEQLLAAMKQGPGANRGNSGLDRRSRERWPVRAARNPGISRRNPRVSPPTPGYSAARCAPPR
jgi:two-component system, cell cycle response regulator DivK